MINSVVKKHDKIYYARIIENTYICDVYDLVVRTVGETFFVACDKRDKKAYLFLYSDIDDSVFLDRKLALNKIMEARENRKINDYNYETGNKEFYNEEREE